MDLKEATSERGIRVAEYGLVISQWHPLYSRREIDTLRGYVKRPSFYFSSYQEIAKHFGVYFATVGRIIRAAKAGRRHAGGRAA